MSRLLSYAVEQLLKIDLSTEDGEMALSSMVSTNLLIDVSQLYLRLESIQRDVAVILAAEQLTLVASDADGAPAWVRRAANISRQRLELKSVAIIDQNSSQQRTSQMLQTVDLSCDIVSDAVANSMTIDIHVRRMSNGMLDEFMLHAMLRLRLGRAPSSTSTCRTECLTIFG